MQNRKRKVLSLQMLQFEFRKVTGNPFTHIFGIGMPILLMLMISSMIIRQIDYEPAAVMAVTSVFLGISSVIPMATVFMGYGVTHAQELEKNIPQRMELFGIKQSDSLCNRAVSEGIFMILAFFLYFVVGYVLLDIKPPTVSGMLIYLLCMVVFSAVLFCMSHAISSLLKKFGLTYCVTMMMYFAFMIFGGMMGISYSDMPEAMQMIAKLLPVTYINKDFYSVWTGESYNFMPMIQSYLLLAAVTGILLFVAFKRGKRKLH